MDDANQTRETGPGVIPNSQAHFNGNYQLPVIWLQADGKLHCICEQTIFS